MRMFLHVLCFLHILLYIFLLFVNHIRYLNNLSFNNPFDSLITLMNLLHQTKIQLSNHLSNQILYHHSFYILLLYNAMNIYVHIKSHNDHYAHILYHMHRILLYRFHLNKFMDMYCHIDLPIINLVDILNYIYQFRYHNHRYHLWFYSE